MKIELFPQTTPVLPAAVKLLDGLRSVWRTRTLARAAALAVAWGLGAVLALLALDLIWPLPADLRRVLRWAPALLAGAPLLVALWRAMHPPDRRQLALLAEERLPLGNRLLTALSLQEGPVQSRVARAFCAEADRVLSRADPRAAVAWRIRPPLFALTAELLLLLGLATLWPAEARQQWERWANPRSAHPAAGVVERAAVPSGAAAPVVGGFGELHWSITPPAYTGRAARDLQSGDPGDVLIGSRIRVRGALPKEGTIVRAELIGGAAVPVREEEDQWSVEWVLNSGARGLRLRAEIEGRTVAQRVIPLGVIADQPPTVTLRQPEQDVVFAGPTGRLSLRATARDDYGVADLRLSWIRSRGSGESFSFSEGEWQWGRLRRNEAAIAGELTLDLAAADLRPGDVLHIRAIARDRNAVTGPGEGVSETRLLRIALPDEMHTVTTLVGMPPEAEMHPVLSQRMLILMTERLRDRAPRLGREAVLREAEEIAVEQGRLRERVGEQIFTRSAGGIQNPGLHFGFEDESGADHAGAGHDEPEHGAPASAGSPTAPGAILEEASRATGTGSPDEVGHRHDEAPIIAVSQPLLSVYNAMWAAERALRQGEPRAALPHQYEALRLLKELQAGERVYARGVPRVPPVDVAAARGSGKLDEVDPAARSANQPLPDPRSLLSRLDAVVARHSRRSAPEFADALTALAARVLAEPAADARAGALLSRAAEAAAEEEDSRAIELARQARALLDPARSSGTAAPLPSPADGAAAEYFRRLGDGR